MADKAMTELVQMVQDSKIRGLKLTVEVTPGGFTSKLEDHKGQRGSAVSGVLKRGLDSDFDTLDGQANFLILQEARRALKAEK